MEDKKNFDELRSEIGTLKKGQEKIKEILLGAVQKLEALALQLKKENPLNQDLLVLITFRSY